MNFDDHEVPSRTLEEIEGEADRCRLRVQIGADGRIDVYQMLKAWGIDLVIKSDAEMGDDEAYSIADKRQICCRRSIARGLRFGDPHARYIIGHELGHMFLHRGHAPKARKIDGNKKYSFIEEDESGEAHAWKFVRALFVTRDDLTSKESDEDTALRVGIPAGAVSLRRDEVRKAMQAKLPKAVPVDVTEYIEKARRAEKAAEAARKAEARIEMEMRTAWARAAQIPGENPAKVRLARGFKVAWSHYGMDPELSHFGWKIVDGEVRSMMDLQSR